MKRKANEDNSFEVVSKKQIVEEEPEEVKLPKKTPSKKKGASVEDDSTQELANGKASKTPKSSKTPRKLPSTTPRKTSSRTAPPAATEESSQQLSNGQTATPPPPMSRPKSTDKPKEASCEKKVKVSTPKVEKSAPNADNNSSFALLPAIDLALFGASWFFFGMLSVWLVLRMTQADLANTVQDRVLGIINHVTCSQQHFLVTELIYFVMTILGFHFVLTLVMDLVE
mmetsp:Transcript_1740/g.3279  ORF Transcript_1740/g.3279 Transcript_1740/m.3279 type:complete len:227 (-) Transcript_1740:99-779(-)